MALSTLAPTTVECPQCGKHSIVTPSEGEYECLNCDFHKSLGAHADEEQASGGSLKTLIGLLGTLAVLFLFV